MITVPKASWVIIVMKIYNDSTGQDFGEDHCTKYLARQLRMQLKSCLACGHHRELNVRNPVSGPAIQPARRTFTIEVGRRAGVGYFVRRDERIDVDYGVINATNFTQDEWHDTTSGADIEIGRFGSEPVS